MQLTLADVPLSKKLVQHLFDYKSGIVGISFIQKRLVWYANIMINKKTYSLGYHNDYYEAVAHRLAAEQCLNWNKCDSDSTAYKCIKEFANAGY